ncbi:large ribosomal subunit protein mL54-like [Artemia franciscana]
MILKLVQTAVNITRNYAKPGVAGALGSKKGKAGKLGQTSEKVKLPVETDPVKLVTYCCGSNFMKEGEDIKLKEDSEYPEWLWNLRLKEKNLEDMDPETLEYWEYVRELNNIRYKRIAQTKDF